MRELASGVFLENKYAGVRLGAIAGGDELLLIDCPIRVEDGREWLSALAPRGRARYMVVLDHHPDRVLGARGLELPIVAHDLTRQVMATWPDTYKGGASPIGAEADRLKRITGVRKAIPELTFSETMVLLLGDREIRLCHKPGPTQGSIWVDLPERKIAFVGDAVATAEPPYLGEADLQAWMTTLDEMRRLAIQGYTFVSARDGRIEPASAAAMTRFLRKVSGRLERLADEGQPAEAAAALSSSLLGGFKVPAARREQALLRLQAGLSRLYVRLVRAGE